MVDISLNCRLLLSAKLPHFSVQWGSGKGEERLQRCFRYVFNFHFLSLQLTVIVQYIFLGFCSGGIGPYFIPLLFATPFITY